MNVVEHRPPLKRIDFGPRKQPVEQSSMYEVEDGYALAERDRIWRLIEQTARGSVCEQERCE